MVAQSKTLASKPQTGGAENNEAWDTVQRTPVLSSRSLGSSSDLTTSAPTHRHESFGPVTAASWGPMTLSIKCVFTNSVFSGDQKGSSGTRALCPTELGGWERDSAKAQAGACFTPPPPGPSPGQSAAGQCFPRPAHRPAEEPSRGKDGSPVNLKPR